MRFALLKSLTLHTRPRSHTNFVSNRRVRRFRVMIDPHFWFECTHICHDFSIAYSNIDHILWEIRQCLSYLFFGVHIIIVLHFIRMDFFAVFVIPNAVVVYKTGCIFVHISSPFTLIDSVLFLRIMGIDCGIIRNIIFL